MHFLQQVLTTSCLAALAVGGFLGMTLCILRLLFTRHAPLRRHVPRPRYVDISHLRLMLADRDFDSNGVLLLCREHKHQVLAYVSALLPWLSQGRFSKCLRMCVCLQITKPFSHWMIPSPRLPCTAQHQRRSTVSLLTFSSAYGHHVCDLAQDSSFATPRIRMPSAPTLWCSCPLYSLPVCMLV